MIHFEVAFPSHEDAEIIRRWRNDPEVLSQSFSYRHPLTLEEFFPQYQQKYFSVAALPTLFAVSGEERVGVLRFDPSSQKGIYEISILVAPEKRNQGFGTKILMTVDPFLKRQGIEGLMAQVMQPNQASLKAFLKAGYTIVKEGEIICLEKRFYLRQDEVFIIAEAGSNWYVEGEESGAIERGKKLIEAAKEAGADAVKFQTFQAKDIYVANPGTADYLNQDIKNLFEALEVSETMIACFAEHCKKVGIEFMSSVFSPRDFARIDPLVKRHKIASYEIGYQELIRLAAQSKKPLILSTGASPVEDIDWAVSEFIKEGGQDLTLLQCTAQYPAEDGSMNLSVIPWLKQRYQVKAGLSDHSFNPFAAPIAAVALGACCIEKHFTLSRSLKGPDHSFAIEPQELKELVSLVRQTEKMMGNGCKTIQAEEQELYFFAKRGIQALRDIHPGEILREGVNIAILRPGKQPLGMHPKHLKEIEGRKVNRRIPSGEGIQLIYLE